jgi:LysB family phage lysis regulatory protein
MLQARLIAAGLVVIAFMGLGLVAYHYKVSARDALVARDAAVRDRDMAVTVNKNNEAARLTAEADAAKADKLVSELQDQIDTANQSTLDMATKLSELRANNAKVNNFLSTPIPDDILRLYEQPKATGHH